MKITWPWLAAPSPYKVTQTLLSFLYLWANAIPAPRGTYIFGDFQLLSLQALLTTCNIVFCSVDQNFYIYDRKIPEGLNLFIELYKYLCSNNTIATIKIFCIHMHWSSFSTGASVLTTYRIIITTFIVCIYLWTHKFCSSILYITYNTFECISLMENQLVVKFIPTNSAKTPSIATPRT